MNMRQQWNGDIRTTLTWWGELHEGTESALKAAGLGAGHEFPIIKVGRERELKVLDPRGLPCRIKCDAPGTFYAKIIYSGRDLRPPVLEVAPGVSMTCETYGNVYRGSGEALEAAGVVPRCHFPGMPGMRKTKVRILPDGSVFHGAPQATPPQLRQEGAMRIERSGEDYVVTVNISSEESSDRWRTEKDQEKRLMDLPRPRSLFDSVGVRRQHHLRVASFTEDGARAVSAMPRPMLRLAYSVGRVSP